MKQNRTLITIIGRGHSGTRAISHTLSASGVHMGEPINPSGDLVPAEAMYEACRVMAKFVTWKSGLNWDFSRLHDIGIPAGTNPGKALSLGGGLPRALLRTDQQPAFRRHARLRRYLPRINRFVEQVDAGVTPAQIDGAGAEGLATQKALAAAIESFETGRAEKV